MIDGDLTDVYLKTWKNNMKRRPSPFPKTWSFSFLNINSLPFRNERPRCAAMLSYHSIIRVTKPGEHIVNSWRSMIPVGRSCKWPVWQLGFSPWLQLAPSDTGVNVLSAPRQKYSSWVGGSIFTCLSRFQHMWVRRQQCSEEGSTSVCRRWWKRDSFYFSAILCLAGTQFENKEFATHNALRPVIRKSYNTFSRSNRILLTSDFIILNICGASYSICHIEGKPSARWVSSVSIHEHLSFIYRLCFPSCFICNVCGHVDPWGFV